MKLSISERLDEKLENEENELNNIESKSENKLSIN